jgi:hypothetical protein
MCQCVNLVSLANSNLHYKRTTYVQLEGSLMVSKHTLLTEINSKFICGREITKLV